MKQCAHCKQAKKEEDFAWSNKRRRIKQKHCRDCMSQFNKTSYNKDQESYRQNIYNNREKRRLKHRQYVWDYLSHHPCADCGESDPRVLEFHHIRGRGKKKDAVSQLANGRYSLETIQKEIDKCDVLCANCHRKKTFEEKGWFNGK